MLATTSVDELPDVFLDGSLEGDAVFRADTDVVINPATILSHLRDGLESRCIDGEIVRFGLVSDDAIDHVQVQVGDQVVPIVPRFVVLAAGVGNAALLSKLGSRFADQARRKSSKELVESSQAVQSQYVLCVRGRDLPEVSGRFGELTIASHTLTDSGDRVWLVAPPVDDALTTLGPDNLRFERPVDSAVVSRTIDQLFAASPALAKQAADLQFGVYVARRTQHPMVAVADASIVAQPAPAKLEKFGLESFLAVWPSHLAYAQFVGDSVAERIAEALGPPAGLLRRSPAVRPRRHRPAPAGPLGPHRLPVAALVGLRQPPTPSPTPDPRRPAPANLSLRASVRWLTGSAWPNRFGDGVVSGVGAVDGAVRQGARRAR